MPAGRRDEQEKSKVKSPTCDIGTWGTRPLSQRELSDEEIASAVSGRLKNAPDEEKRAVALYVSSFMKRK